MSADGLIQPLRSIKIQANPLLLQLHILNDQTHSVSLKFFSERTFSQTRKSSAGSGRTLAVSLWGARRGHTCDVVAHAVSLHQAPHRVNHTAQLGRPTGHPTGRDPRWRVS